MMAPAFKFSMRYVGRPRDSYYMTRWDQAKTATIVAANQEEAVDALKTCLGKPPGPLDGDWAIAVDHIEHAPHIAEGRGQAAIELIEIRKLEENLDRLARFAAIQGVDLRDTGADEPPDASYDEWRSLPADLQDLVNKHELQVDPEQQGGHGE